MDFANNFRNARLKAGLSQQQVAEKLKKERSTIAKYENGNSTPNINNLSEICEVLNISVMELLK